MLQRGVTLFFVQWEAAEEAADLQWALCSCCWHYGSGSGCCVPQRPDFPLLWTLPLETIVSSYTWASLSPVLKSQLLAWLASECKIQWAWEGWHVRLRQHFILGHLIIIFPFSKSWDLSCSPRYFRASPSSLWCGWWFLAPVCDVMVIIASVLLKCISYLAFVLYFLKLIVDFYCTMVLLLCFILLYDTWRTFYKAS